ncbi:MAG: helix-turn-helix domain-containing protein [Clostridia bacterium]|nr:helix-turn-helix domain-containing protein [Clostridia bacterium]
MHPTLMERLDPITPEEKSILSGGRIDPTLYSEGEEGVFNAKKLLESGKLISLRPHTRFVHFPEHTHDFVEMVYMCKGKTEHVVNGVPVLLREGELLFLGQNARQEILPASKDDLAVNFIVLPAFFQKTLELLGGENTPIKRFLLESLFEEGSKGYLHFQVSSVLPVQNLVENLIWTLIQTSSNKRNISQNTMALLFMELTNHMETLVFQNREEGALVKIYRYIEEHYRDGSLSDAATELHYDLFWLSHFLSAQTGKTFTEFMQEKRMAQATYLLKNTRLPVEDISRLVGYQNKSYFHRIFLKNYGTTPKKYRDQI